MKKNLLSLLLILFASCLALAQPNEENNKNKKESNNKQLLNNNINFGVGYGIIAFNANTTFQRLKAHKKIYSTWSVGLNYLNVTFFSDDHVFIPSLRFGIITGIDKKHHFEINAGPHLLVGLYNDGFDLATSEFDFGFNIGYRKQKPQDSKIFKLGVGYPELLYVALGFSF
tara:strand:+ start:341 stop:853 length:513 start_codon:yes stop_codon:yes gene_type:complete